MHSHSKLTLLRHDIEGYAALMAEMLDEEDENDEEQQEQVGGEEEQEEKNNAPLAPSQQPSRLSQRAHPSPARDPLSPIRGRRRKEVQPETIIDPKNKPIDLADLDNDLLALMRDSFFVGGIEDPAIQRCIEYINRRLGGKEKS